MKNNAINHKKFILASSSPRRIELLTNCFLEPKAIIAPNVDESILKKEKPREYVKRIAILKAAAISHQYPDDIILACDTTVAVGSRILGKPDSREGALEMLKLLSGRRHKVYSCVCVKQSAKERYRVVETTVQFKLLSIKEIELLVSTDEYKDKAGAYAIQGLASMFIKQINGSFSNVVGLPMMETITLLANI